MKEQYQIRNWSEYNAGLKQRGSLTFWISEEVIEGWLLQFSDGYGTSFSLKEIAKKVFLLKRSNRATAHVS